MELMECPNLAVPREVMHHVVRVESSFNPYAIGVVGGRLARQPRNLGEAVATARMLESRGYNFSLGLAQVNRYNLAKQGLTSYEQAFQACPNLQAGSRILAECHGRSGNSWGKAFSCYYSGNFVTGYRHGYVQKVFASMQRPASPSPGLAIEVLGTPKRVRSPSGASPPGTPVAATAQSARIAMRTAQRPVAASHIAQAMPPASAAVPAVPPRSAGPAAATYPQARSVAVLDPAGGAPEIIPGEPVGSDVVASTAPQAPIPDAAFVF